MAVTWNNWCWFYSETIWTRHSASTSYNHIENNQILVCWWVSNMTKRFFSSLNSFISLTITLSSAIGHMSLVCVWARGSPESLTEVQGSLLLVAKGKEHSLPLGCVNSKNSHLRFTMFLKFWRCGFYANEKLSISIQVHKMFGNQFNNADIFECLTPARCFRLK